MILSTFPQLWRHRTAICLTLVAVLILLLLSVIAVPPVVTYAQNRQTLIALYDRLGRYQAMGARRDVVITALADFDDAMAALDEYLLPPETESVLQADLQALVQDIVTRHGGQVMSTQAMDLHHSQGHPGLRLHFKSSLDQLVTTLHALEFGKPALVIREFNVQASRVPAHHGDSGTASLDVRLVAQAFASTPVSE